MRYHLSHSSLKTARRREPRTGLRHGVVTAVGQLALWAVRKWKGVIVSLYQDRTVTEQ